jgi:hypothetical protein
MHKSIVSQDEIKKINSSLYEKKSIPMYYSDTRMSVVIDGEHYVISDISQTRGIKPNDIDERKKYTYDNDLDIILDAKLTVTDENGKKYILKPAFYLYDNKKINAPIPCSYLDSRYLDTRKINITSQIKTIKFTESARFACTYCAIFKLPKTPTKGWEFDYGELTGLSFHKSWTQKMWETRLKLDNIFSQKTWQQRPDFLTKGKSKWYIRNVGSAEYIPYYKVLDLYKNINGIKFNTTQECNKKLACNVAICIGGSCVAKFVDEVTDIMIPVSSLKYHQVEMHVRFDEKNFGYGTDGLEMIIDYDNVTHSTITDVKQDILNGYCVINGMLINKDQVTFHKNNNTTVHNDCITSKSDKNELCDVAL